MRIRLDTDVRLSRSHVRNVLLATRFKAGGSRWCVAARLLLLVVPDNILELHSPDGYARLDAGVIRRSASRLEEPPPLAEHDRYDTHREFVEEVGGQEL